MRMVVTISFYLTPFLDRDYLTKRWWEGHSISLQHRTMHCRKLDVSIVINIYTVYNKFYRFWVSYHNLTKPSQKHFQAVHRDNFRSQSNNTKTFLFSLSWFPSVQWSLTRTWSHWSATATEFHASPLYLCIWTLEVGTHSPLPARMGL